MASRILRNFVYGLLVETPGLAATGYKPDVISPNFTPDAPTGDKFIIMRWGTLTKGIAQVNQVRLSCWVYNRQPDFGPIADALKLLKARILTIEGVVMTQPPLPMEAVLGVAFEGDSDDLYDDGYRAHTRWTSHTITASGS